ncbi:Putative sugar transporter, major facilitator superfamily, MFS transporter superfamily [Septoria linicola]|uniref:Sugar transporter, major facilitator superfamily, MFS transporter superfamily n=1 Tax=Septoria linicola TaxID=215465 RepID=A0A9Q9B0Q4_9PEZI|nr:Putative sugar transporter, major facilitator superfamily, MFS transporter superfamily [Septoria linicola]
MAQKDEPTPEQEAIILNPLPLTNLPTKTIGWSSPSDPSMPYNFPLTQNYTWLAVNQEFHNDNDWLGSMTVSIFLFGYVVGPVFIGPLSEIYGRKWVFVISCVGFCVWQVGCGLAGSVEVLVVCRFWAGVGGAAPLALGGSIIGDLFRPHERGFAMGIWNLGPLLGPVIGPLLGGFVTQYIGWRWDFWIVLAAATPVTLAIAIFTKETGHKALIRTKTLGLRKDLGIHDLRSCYEGSSAESSTWQAIRLSLVRPFKLMVFSPIVFALGAYIAFLFGTVYLLYTTIPSVFEDLHGFSTGETGFPYLALGLGNVLGSLLFILHSDKMVKQLAKANSGVFLPEMRLAISIPFGILLPISLFWYGWSAEHNLHWSSTILSLVLFGFGVIGLFLPISTYIIDSYPLHAASATSANIIMRSIVGAIATFRTTVVQDVGSWLGKLAFGVHCSRDGAAAIRVL